MLVDEPQELLVSQLTEARVAAHGQIRTIDPQQDIVVSDQFILFLQNFTQGFEIGVVGGVKVVFEKSATVPGDGAVKKGWALDCGWLRLTASKARTIISSSSRREASPAYARQPAQAGNFTGALGFKVITRLPNRSGAIARKNARNSQRGDCRDQRSRWRSARYPLGQSSEIHRSNRRGHFR